MSENPRRWYQFRLSTILVLVAILAWAMACRPYWTADTLRRSTPEEHLAWHAQQSPGQIARVRQKLSQMGRLGPTDKFRVYFSVRGGVNPRLAWPITALAVFLTWKWIAAKWKRRREQPVATSSPDHHTPRTLPDTTHERQAIRGRRRYFGAATRRHATCANSP